jgi:hypothetical protein
MNRTTGIPNRSSVATRYGVNERSSPMPVAPIAKRANAMGTEMEM